MNTHLGLGRYFYPFPLIVQGSAFRSSHFLSSFCKLRLPRAPTFPASWAAADVTTTTDCCPCLQTSVRIVNVIAEFWSFAWPSVAAPTGMLCKLLITIHLHNDRQEQHYICQLRRDLLPQTHATKLNHRGKIQRIRNSPKMRSRS